MRDVATIVAIIGVAGTFAGLAKGLWEFRRKTDLEIFRVYTEKYNNIIKPENYRKWQSALDSNSVENLKDEEMEIVMIKFLNLAWEEVYLHKTGVLRCNIWKVWYPELKLVLHKKFAKEMMKRHRFEFLEQELADLDHKCVRSIFSRCAVKRMISRNCVRG
jgi:hypothetical protein